MGRIKKFLVPFQNIKFNIGLFAVLALASISGTIIPQMPENPDRVKQWMLSRPNVGQWLEKLQFFDVYHSWWFIGLLGLMAFDVIVCKLIFGKFPGFATFPQGQRRADFVRGLALRRQWESVREPSACALGVSQELQKQGYKVEVVQENGGYLVLAAKHRAQRFGSWVSHIAIVLVLLSNLLGALYGFREVVNIPEGGAVRMQHRPWTLVCDDFSVEWYDNSTTPRTFASQLRLFDHGQLAKDQKILVNEPMVYHTARFYQATYAPHFEKARIGVFLRDRPQDSPTLVLRLGEDVRVPGTDYSLRVLQFAPDFVMTKEGPSSKSALPNNPALRILISKNGQAQKAVWIFSNYQGMHMPPITEDDEFILILADYGHAFATGVQITYDPGANLFWLACAILVVALMILFYLHHRRVWVLCAPNVSGGSLVTGGAQSSRGKHFEDDWKRLADVLNGATGGAGTGSGSSVAQPSVTSDFSAGGSGSGQASGSSDFSAGGSGSGQPSGSSDFSAGGSGSAAGPSAGADDGK